MMNSFLEFVMFSDGGMIASFSRHVFDVIRLFSEKQGLILEKFFPFFILD